MARNPLSPAGSWLALLLPLAFSPACSDATGAPPAPTIASVAGEYAAVEMATTEAGGTTDWLAEGGSIHLDLRVDGTTSGRIFVPGSAEEGADLNASLEGAWSLAGEEVHLAHEADTFLRDLPLRVSDDRLDGSAVFGGVRVRVQVVLVRDD